MVVRDAVLRVDTVRVAGRRMLFVPPGQYPPEGMCRVWVHDLPPGWQADPAPCNALGVIPPGRSCCSAGRRGMRSMTGWRRCGEGGCRRRYLGRGGGGGRRALI